MVKQWSMGWKSVQKDTLNYIILVTIYIEYAPKALQPGILASTIRKKSCKLCLLISIHSSRSNLRFFVILFGPLPSVFYAAVSIHYSNLLFRLF